MRSMLMMVMVALPVVASAQTAAAPASAQAPAAPAAAQSAFKTDKEKLSYALGMDLGGQLKARGIDVDTAVFAKAFVDAFSGGKTLLTDTEAKATIADLQKTLAIKQAAEAKVVGDKNKAAGEAFLAANKAKEGVVSLPSGLQYKILKEGTGPKPTAADKVTCHYRGTLIDGKEFDSSYKRGEPATFPVGGVIKGWTEVLQLMPVGSKWQVFIPGSLGYGERGAGPDIGPNATLIFEIELVAIAK
jgi:FKBP-type peptidyl-prolyl cis-trans isomerase